MSEDDHAEIISRPPSHPIATTLLVASMIATIICISLTTNELFTEYLPSAGPGKKIDKYHNSIKIAEKDVRDHYKADGDFRVSIEEELGGKDKPLTSIGGGQGLGN